MKDEFPFLNEKGHVISIVGAGGKTSLLYYLAQKFSDNGYRTAVLTTTKIFKPEYYCETMEECRQCWKQKKYAVCGQEFSAEKLTVPRDSFLQEVLEEADAVVIEADGAAGMACKIPAEHEPVILSESDIVIAVMGLDALGRPIADVCFRSDQVADFLKCSATHPLNEKDMVKILVSDRGSRKSVDDRAYYIVLNKCDGESRIKSGEKIRNELECQGYKAFMTCFK